MRPGGRKPIEEQGKKPPVSSKQRRGGQMGSQQSKSPAEQRQVNPSAQPKRESVERAAGSHQSTLPSSSKPAPSGHGAGSEELTYREVPKEEGVVKRSQKVPTPEDMARYEAYVGQEWTGACKWFNVAKGFGFIMPDFEEAKQHDDDVFVHQSSLQMPGFRSLDEGETVEFTVRLGRRGLEAENVRGVAGASIRGHSIRPLGKKKETKIRCYKCGQLGQHKASKCKSAPSGSGEKVKMCYHCHATDHLLADCPSYKAKREVKAHPSEA